MLFLSVSRSHSTTLVIWLLEMVLRKTWSMVTQKLQNSIGNTNFRFFHYENIPDWIVESKQTKKMIEKASLVGKSFKFLVG